MRLRDSAGTTRVEVIGPPKAWIVNAGDGALIRHAGDPWRHGCAVVDEVGGRRVVCPDETSLRPAATTVDGQVA